MNKLKRTHLLQQAHKLKPVVYIAEKGLTENIQMEIQAALKAHGLIKLKFAGYDKAEKKALLESICEASKAETVQLIGHIATLYKQKPVKKMLYKSKTQKTKVKAKAPKIGTLDSKPKVRARYEKPVRATKSLRVRTRPSRSSP